MSREPDLPASLTLPEDLARALAGASDRLGPVATSVFFVSSVGSTNDVAERLALAGAVEGTTVVADMQTAGRGRMGRTWFSPPGAGLYASIVLRPAAAKPTSFITLLAGVVLADAIREATGLQASLKWPNDLVMGRRKLCGILAESSAQHGTIDHVIVGFGINLRAVTFPSGIADRATSIEAELGRPVDRGDVLVALLAAMAAGLRDLRASRFGAILGRWRSLAPTSAGAAVEWDHPDGAQRGVTAGIDDEGALLVRVGSRVERIIAGEVRWLEPGR